jgi:EAL domain-containing protein (putative c-di-GMP-specific phosphodiesterase class I)
MPSHDADLIEELAAGIERHEIVAFFQPQVELASERVVAGEALARWRHPRHGLLAPDIFIPAAQQHRLIDELGLLMLEAAWEAALHWRQEGTPVQVSVNASATQLTSDRLTDRLTELLTTSTLAPGTVTIEITETEPFFDLPEAAERLTGLRDLGLGISIDDFGHGHSSLARLNDLPATELKIDLSMIQDESDEGDRSLDAIVEYAHDRGIRVVAEGIETESQRLRVVSMGCQRGQGFLFAPPMSRDHFDVLLMEQPD